MEGEFPPLFRFQVVSSLVPEAESDLMPYGGRVMGQTDDRDLQRRLCPARCGLLVDQESRVHGRFEEAHIAAL